MVLADTPAIPPDRKACEVVIRLSFAVLILLHLQCNPLVARGDRTRGTAHAQSHVTFGGQGGKFEDLPIIVQSWRELWRKL